MMGESFNFGYWGKTSEEILKNQFPLHRCCRDGDVEALTALLHEDNHGIYVEDSFYGWTPAHWAAYFGKLGCLRKLMSLTRVGVDCNMATARFRQTPCHVAAYGGHPSLLQWLLQSGAGIDDKDYLSETALHKAARTGSMECVSLLVAHGADLSALNQNNHTASQLAKAYGYYECARFLSEAFERSAAMRQLNGDHRVAMTTTDASDSMDYDMDLVDSGSVANGSGDGSHNNPRLHSTHINGYHSNGMHNNNGAMNAHHGNGGEADILLHQGVGSNHIPIAGKKRPREDSNDDESKRIRTATRDTVTSPASAGAAEPSSSVQSDRSSRDVLFAIGASMSPSSSILSVPTTALRLSADSPHIRRSPPDGSARRYVFAV